MEAAAAGIELIVCITEGIPVAQIVEVKSFVERPVRALSDQVSGCFDARCRQKASCPALSLKRAEWELFRAR